MKITISTIALSVLLSGISFSQEIERPRLSERLAERETTKKQAVVKIGLIKRGLDRRGVNRPRRVQKPEISDDTREFPRSIFMVPKFAELAFVGKPYPINDSFL